MIGSRSSQAKLACGNDLSKAADFRTVVESMVDFYLACKVHRLC